jgi:hypothetical protein
MFPRCTSDDTALNDPPIFASPATSIYEMVVYVEGLTCLDGLTGAS